MIMYMVHRNVDDLSPHEYGVSESNYLIGIFSNEAVAKAVAEDAKAEAKKYDCMTQYDYHETTISIIPVEINKTYETKKQMYLGGGFYIE